METGFMVEHWISNLGVMSSNPVGDGQKLPDVIKSSFYFKTIFRFWKIFQILKIISDSGNFSGSERNFRV